MADEIWTCKDGRKIPVGEMHEEHVRNALRLILRTQRKRRMEFGEGLAKALMKALLLKAGRPSKADAEQEVPLRGCDSYGSLPD